MSHSDPEGWGSLLLPHDVGMTLGSKTFKNMEGMVWVYLLWGDAQGPRQGCGLCLRPPHTRLGLGTSHRVSLLQRIPNSMLISLVQERLNEDDCLRRVRLCGTACLRVAARIRGEGIHLSVR